jgi:hypothetical protein
MSIVGSVLRIALAAAIGALPANAEAHPNFSGIWKINATGTDASSSPTNVVFAIDHKEPKFKYTAKGTSGAGPFEESFTFSTDGSIVPVDPRELSVGGVWNGQALVVRYHKDGKQLATVEFRLSPDGKRMTRRGEIGARKIVEVYDRQ